MRNNHRDKEGQGDSANAPIGTETDQGVGGQDGCTAAGREAIGVEENEQGEDNKPPGLQRVKVMSPSGTKKTQRRSISQLVSQLVSQKQGARHGPSPRGALIGSIGGGKPSEEESRPSTVFNEGSRGGIKGSN